MTIAQTQTKRLAILFAAGFVVVNVAFYVLSGSYFETHHQVVNGASVPLYSPEQQSHLRIVFALVSGAVAAVGFLAGLRRRLVGHVLAAVLGAVNLAGGIAALVQHGPAALIATLGITGAAMPVLAWLSYHRARAAWAFLVALCGVLAVVGLFGAPKIRGMLDVSLWTTMLLPGLLAVACFTLILLRDDYVDRTPTT
ncbi:MAG TPA: hypothetical protein VK601_09670 [Kofleriaceae bacterium]|nr:hypothetical protein [Kofleriaceae bacterium]